MYQIVEKAGLLAYAHDLHAGLYPFVNPSQSCRSFIPYTYPQIYALPMIPYASASFVFVGRIFFS